MVNNVLSMSNFVCVCPWLNVYVICIWACLTLYILYMYVCVRACVCVWCVCVCVCVCVCERVRVFCVLRACGCLTNAYVRMSMRLTFCACRRFGLTKRKQHFSDHRKIWQACPEY